MAEIAKLQAERTAIFQDVHSNKIPKRVPVQISLSYEATAQVGGLDLAVAQWDPSAMAEAADLVCRTIYSDICPVGASLRYPSFYGILHSQSFVMGSGGFIQHPEVSGMDVSDYDYLSDKPYDCLLERVIPRQYKALATSNPAVFGLQFAKSYTAYQEDLGKTIANIIPLVSKYGYFPGFPGGFTVAPFDFLADQLRGFKNITLDVRRIPQKVAAACDALLPILFKKGLPKTPHPIARVTYPLHMPTFLREKDFKELWWPSFKRLCDTYAAMGIQNHLWCEDDWTRYVDYLYELPANTLLTFEYGDMKKFKDVLGKKHIIAGLYPVGLLSTASRQQCIDKAKEMLDVLAPEGKYIFSMDKVIITMSDKELDNLCAVAEYVRDNGLYSNAGKTAGLEFCQGDYPAQIVPPVTSIYYKTWDQYKASDPSLSDLGQIKLQDLEERLFQYVISLLI